MMSGRMRFFCSSVPNTTIGLGPKMLSGSPRRPQGRAGLGHRLHHDRGLGDAEPRAAVFLRHGDAEPAALRDRLMERVRKPAVAVACKPILVVEAGAELRDGVPQLELIRGEGKIHVRLAPSAEEPR